MVFFSQGAGSPTGPFASPARDRLRVVKTAVVLLLAFFVVPAASASAAGAQRKLVNVYAGPVGPAAEGEELGAYPDPTFISGGACTAIPASADTTWRTVTDVQPLAATAGSHTDQCVGFAVTPQVDASTNPAVPDPDPDLLSKDPGDDVKTIQFDLPSGFQAAPGTAPTCSAGQFRINPDGSDPGLPTAPFYATEAKNACPTDSKVGVARVATYIDELRLSDDALRGPVFNLAPGAGEVARLGIEVSPIPGITYPIRVVVKVGFAPGSEQRLRATATLPRIAAFQRKTPDANDDPNLYEVRPDLHPLLIEGTGITMWGNKVEHPELAAPVFAQHGTQCGVDLSTTATATTYKGVVSTMTSAPYRLTGCGQLPFAASVALSGVSREAAVPTALTVKVNVPQPADPLAKLPSLVKDVKVTLPPGFEVGAQVASGAGGLPLCSAAQFAVDAGGPATCPSRSRVGSVTITSPLIKVPFVGSVYLGAQDAVGELPRLYVDAALPNDTTPGAAHVKLQGRTTVSETGQITASFTDNPQLRFSALEIHFDGGPSALFVTPRTCGTVTGGGSVTPTNGAAPVAIAPALTIDQNCAPAPFAPTVNFGATDARSGVFSSTQITIERTDRSAWLQKMQVSLPAGFLADLNVPTECSAADAAAATCPASSRIASVTTTAGVGAEPYALRGSMYMTTPDAGSVAGVVIVVRAKIGEIDLGDVIVPGRLVLRPNDTGIDFSADLPTRFKGLALNLRRVVVDMDRQNFALNPSGCGPIPYSAVATGDGGETATPSGSVSYSGCAALPFSPTITARLTGDIEPGGHPGMYVELNKPAGDSNLKGATVVLPEGVAADLKNVQVSCTREQFDTVTCPASTRVGGAIADVSIATERIYGDIYLVKVPGETLPGLGLSFNGRYAQRVMSVVKINPQGRLITRFDAIPDLPLRKIIVDVAGGAKGPLQLGKEDCANGTRWDAEFVGQGGQRSKDQIGLRCAARSIVKLSDRGGFTLRNFDFGGRNLRSAKVTLPAGWAIDTKRAKSNTKKNWSRLTGGKAKTKYSKRSIALTVKGSSASTLRIKLLGSAIKNKAAKKTKKGKKAKAKTVEVKVRFAFTDGAIQNQTIKVKAK